MIFWIYLVRAKWKPYYGRIRVPCTRVLDNERLYRKIAKYWSFGVRFIHIAQLVLGASCFGGDENTVTYETGCQAKPTNRKFIDGDIAWNFENNYRQYN